MGFFIVYLNHQPQSEEMGGSPMKRCSIVVHSVSGNCFIIGSCLKEALEKRNVDVRFYRVEDPDLHIWANKEETANDYYEDIMTLPVVTPEKLIKSDMIIFGCPTVFGNMTAEMKTFIDTTVEMCEDHALADKFFACFTSCRFSLCEGSRCLDSLIYWAQENGMIHIPFGIHAELPSCHQPVQGIAHLEGSESLVRPSTQFGEEIDLYADNLASYIQE